MTHSRFNLILGFIAAIAFLASCSHGERIPDWVASGKADKIYKPIEYMIGIAQGPSVAGAKDNARAEIAKQFSVKVEGHLEVLQQYSGLTGDKGSSWLTQTSIQDLTRTYTDETIQGIEIAEVWSNEAGTESWALAVLRRSPALIRLQVQVTDLDDEIARRWGASKSASDLLHKIRPLVQALELMKEREIKNQQLMVVNYAGVGIEADLSMASLNEALTAALKELKIAVVIEGDQDNRIRNAIVTSLTNGKIMVQDDTETADIIIQGVLKAEETNEGNRTPYIFAKLSAQLSLVNTQDGRTFGQVEHSLRDGANTWKDAKEKTLTKLVAKIMADFNAKLYDYLSL
jgi:hypothetical protein